MPALDTLLQLTDHPDPFRNAPDDLQAIQLQALRERFVQRRQQIRILDKRATDAGVTELSSLDDAVPLLFADAVYKSYPESFIEQGKWSRLTAWLQTLTARKIEGPDYANVADMDDWINELRRNGHYVMSSSGTSGKQSFIYQSGVDRELGWRLMGQGIRWAASAMRDSSRRYPVFLLTPSSGSYTGTERMSKFAESIAIPGDIHYMSDVPQSAAHTTRMARMRRAIADGTARPSEIASFQAESRERGERVQADFRRFIDLLLERRHEPMFIMGMMGMLYQIVATARERGIPDGDFHPDTVITIGGGKKGANLPEDFQQQCARFFNFNATNFNDGYGMGEISGFCPWFHAANAWAVPPWLVPLVLDSTGERLLNPPDGKGVVEGRLAIVDLLADGRWGGVIGGDKVVVEFGHDIDGVRTPVIRDVMRYKDLPGGDDKLSCAGTLDAYVRGELGDMVEAARPA
ncbi:hypothetical protein [Paraburkholderia sp. BL10I2N1]|uniref:hypothetical protein n=1 Tax=Paraburkholderia sp. BL10I2N1 TaxID=1938796 RepID=UPI00105B79A6|nr:hypothetical protein [Paraburkholderia sp. BL10I2N1]TDN59188.1 hypothetical protein B0G77_8387 [Paraburkholderia sp. BL10I2N1]